MFFKFYEQFLPFRSKFLYESIIFVRADPPVEPILIHQLQTPRNRLYTPLNAFQVLLVVALLILVRDTQSLLENAQFFIRELKLLQDTFHLIENGLFLDPSPIGAVSMIVCAMVVDILPFLEFRREKTFAIRTRNKSSENIGFLGSLERFLGKARYHILNLIEKVAGDQRFVAVRKHLILIEHLSVVEWVFEDMLDLACGKSFPNSTLQSKMFHFFGKFEHREVARSVEFKHFYNEKILVRIENNIFLPVLKSDIFIANRSFMRKLSAPHLLLQTPLHVVAQLENIASSYEHAQVPTLKLRTIGVLMQDQVFSNEVDFQLSTLTELIQNN